MRLFLSTLALVLCCSTAGAQGSNAGLASSSDAARAGTLKTVQGVVTVTNAQGLHPVHSGDPVAEADRLVTGVDSAASVVMRDGTTLVLGPNSQLDITSFAFNGTTQKGNMFISLLRGSLRMVTGLVGKGNPDAVKITTPTSVIGVLGTDFLVRADEGRP
ncbi:FecR family protein [Rhodoferax sp.]|uniref:FecR family protein n=1 Tax=Rhodoferax sp. TaxID=50421 RepID=UPI0025F3DB92|nr:FecR family protein [Rhodoferax sp.]